jgi:tRNA-2-methylthio-N6-dimethylallyladenosine synthase
MKKVYIKTFGCQMNFHDSERLLGLLNAQGYCAVEDPRDADLIIFNTCSIREKAEQKFFSQLGRTKHIKRKNPSVKIGIAGCIAQQRGEELLNRVPYVDFVLGPQNISRIGEAISTDKSVITEENEELHILDIPAFRKKGVSAWVNIMYGCNNFCSYCIVPYTRGRERSRPADSIVGEIRMLVSEGYKEVTLLGQNVNSYRSETDFVGLLRMVNGIEGLERIRFVTSHPKDLGSDLINAIRELEKVCEHIHLPLQSGSDRILRLMNRKYTMEDYLKKVELLRDAVPDISITTDIIAGFPTETEEDHQATIRALEEIQFDGIFAFKFSPRPMTKASEMQGQLPEEIRLERLNEILKLQDKITERKNALLKGKTVEVLVEGSSESVSDLFTGRTRTNKIVNIRTDRPLMAGEIVKVRITTPHRHSLDGIVLS